LGLNLLGLSVYLYVILIIQGSS